MKHLGIALHSKDSSLVAASDPEELKRLREGFMKKKLVLMQIDAELDAALKDVMAMMASEHNKRRVRVCYLLAEKFGKLGLFACNASDGRASAPSGPCRSAEVINRYCTEAYARAVTFL